MTTIYFAGSEEIDFKLAGTASTSTAHIDLNFVAEGLTTDTGDVVWPIVNQWSTPSFGTPSSFWVHFGFYNNNAATVASSILLALSDSGGVGRLLVRGTGTTGQLKLSSRNAAGTIVDFSGAVTASGAFTTSALVKVDIFVNYSATGRFSLYFDGVLVADTGAGVDVTTNSATTLSFLHLSSHHTSGGITDYFSEIIISDSDTRSMRLWKMNSSTAGNTQTFSGTASNVNKSTLNDATYISAASSGLIEEFKTGGIALPAGTWNVGAVKLSSRAMVGTSGPQNLEYVLRVGSTDYTGGSWAPSVGSFINDVQNYIVASNPATSGPWATSDFTASTFNYGVESVT